MDSYENADKSITKFIPLSDFSLLETSWVGSYGHIILARHDLTSELKTIKMVGKQTVSEYWDYVETDKNIMAAISTFPFTVKLEGLAQDDQWLYMIMPIVSVNTLFEVLTDKGSLNETTARFFFAQVRHHVIVSIYNIKQWFFLYDSVRFGHLRLFYIQSFFQHHLNCWIQTLFYLNIWPFNIVRYCWR